MASAPEEQALTGACAPARAPSSRDTAAAGPLTISMGTASGKTRRTPFSFRVSHWSSSVLTPPMPVPMTTPRRSGSTSGAPASAQASRAAIRPYWPAGSSRRASTLARTSKGDCLMVAAIFTGSWYVSTQSNGIRVTPDRPARTASQVSVTLPPTGVVAPRPVTTMRCSVFEVIGGSAPCVLWPLWRTGSGLLGIRHWGSRVSAGSRAVLAVVRARRSAAAHHSGHGWSALCSRDEVHGIANRLEVLDLVVGDTHAELLLGVDDDCHHRQRVDVEVVGEGLVQLDGGGVQTGLFVDDLGETIEDLFLALRHEANSLLSSCMVDLPEVLSDPIFPSGRREYSGQDDDLRGVD